MGKGAKVLGFLALLGIVGVAATAGGAEAPTPGEISSGGMVLTDDCQTVTVEDTGEFLGAWLEYAETIQATAWLDVDSAVDVEFLILSFLARHFRDCFGDPVGDPESWDGTVPGVHFAWVTTYPEPFTRSWDELIGDIQAHLRAMPPGLIEGQEAQTPPFDLEAGGRAAAQSPPPVVIAPPPPPPPDDEDDEDERPLPPIPQREGAGLIPPNVLQATSPENMDDAGVELAMQPSAQTGPLPSAVYLVYDPLYPELRQMLAALYEHAADAPDVVFILASFADTRAAFGQPDQIGAIGYGLNAASGTGRWLLPEGARAGEIDGPAPSDPMWDAVISHASEQPRTGQVSPGPGPAIGPPGDGGGFGA